MTPMGEAGRNLAAIDIGTSSLHLAIARPSLSGRPEIVFKQKVPVRLGSGPADMKTLSPTATDRALEVLSEFRALADAHDAQVHAVATSAVREATNRSSFTDRAREEAGIAVEVIAGTEEARLIHLGVLGTLPISDRRHLVIDIGGGSTEVVVGEGVTPEILRSFKLGHVRLTDRFFPGGHIEPMSIPACRTFILSFLARAAATIANTTFDITAGASGTFETIERLVRMRRGTNGGRSEPTTKDEVDSVVESIIAHRLNDPTGQIFNVDEHRQDTIVAGALLVQGLMESLQFNEFVVSPDALREGLVLDRLNRRDPVGGDSLHHLTSIRASSVEAVAVRFGENVVHARQATDIALRLFDATAELHGFDRYERDILEGASMLHNIGRFIGHGAHHRHSYYLIRNSENLAGFNEHERELMAQVARYHRKSVPKPSHPAFQALSEWDQRVVSVLAGALRIGIALDRTYRNVASEIDVVPTSTSVAISVTGENLDLELFAARERKDLLEEALGVTISIDRTESPTPVAAS